MCTAQIVLPCSDPASNRCMTAVEAGDYFGECFQLGLVHSQSTSLEATCTERVAGAHQECDPGSSAQTPCPGFDFDFLRDILKRETARELETMPNLNLLRAKNSEWMRVQAVGWLMEVAHTHFDMESGTLALAVSYLDRLLCCAELRGDSFQDLALVCLRLAAQQEEVVVPPIAAWIYLALLDGAPTPEERHRSFIYLEMWLFRRLEFQGRVPTAHTFLNLFMSALLLQPAGRDSLVACTASYLMHFTLLDANMLAVTLSTAAAAVVCLALGGSAPAVLKQLQLRGAGNIELSHMMGCMDRLREAHSVMLTEGPRLMQEEAMKKPREDMDNAPTDQSDETAFYVLYSVFSSELWMHVAERPLPPQGSFRL